MLHADSHQSLQDVAATAPPAPPSGGYPPILQDGVIFTGFFAADQAKFPYQPTFGSNNVLIEVPPTAQPQPPKIVIGDRDVNNIHVKAFELKGFDSKCGEFGTQQPLRCELTVTCKTAAGATATKSGFIFKETQKERNVVTPFADFGDDKRFGAVVECTFSVKSLDQPTRELLLLIDDFDYQVWRVPKGEKDCRVPS